MEKKKNTVLSAEEKTEMLSFLNEYPNIKTSSVNNHGFSEKAKLILALLLFTANKQDGIFTMGYEYIGKVTGISKRGISLINGKFEALCFYVREKGHKSRNSKYTINYDAIKAYDNELSKCSKLGEVEANIRRSSQTTSNFTTTSNANEELSVQIAELQRDMKKLRELEEVNNKILEEVMKNVNYLLKINIKLNINNNVNNIHEYDISSNENESDEIKNNLNMIQDQTNNISMENKVKINSNVNEMKDMKVVNEKSNSVANVMNDDDNNTKDNDMIQDQTTDSSVDPDNIEGENESMNVENTEMNDTMKNNIPSEDNMKNKSTATTSIQLSVSNTTKNHEGSAAVGGGAENLRNGAGSVILSDVEQLPTEVKKSNNTAPSYSNTAFNGEVDMFYLQHGITQEEYEEAQRSFMPNSWKNLTVHGIKIDNKTVTFTEVLNKLYSTTEIQISLTWWSKMCTTAKQYVQEGKMTETEYIKLRDEIIRLIEAKAKNIWYNTFKKYNNERNAFTYNNYIRKAWTITKNVITDEQKKSFTEEILNIN